jgi:hypothetical protein
MSPELWFGIVSLGLGLVGAVFSALASIIAYFVKKGEEAQDKAILSLHSDQTLLRGDVDIIKQTLAKYESHIGIGDERLQEIRGEIAAHVRKEEQIFWKKVDAIAEAHQVFAEAVLQRIASMEAKMPNGEIQEITKALARLEANSVVTQAAALKAERHVTDHDIEAEEWKRRIVGLETSQSIMVEKSRSRPRKVARAKK